MPYNLPQFDVRKFSIGPAIVYIGVAGQTPTIDLGAIRSAEMKFTYELNKFYQGLPSVPRAMRFKLSDLTLTVKGLEWDFSKLSKTTGGYLVETIDGVSLTQELYANLEYADPISVRLVHTTPSESILTVDLYNAYPGGTDSFAFAQNVHEMTYIFHAASSTIDFAGNAIPPNTPFKITLAMPFGGS